MTKKQGDFLKWVADTLAMFDVSASTTFKILAVFAEEFERQEYNKTIP